jgi:hypothetical protein
VHRYTAGGITCLDVKRQTSKLGPADDHNTTMTYTIICLLIGEATSFLVELDETIIVGELREVIRLNIGYSPHARYLNLYFVNVTGHNEAARIEIVNSKARNLGDLHKLSSFTSLTTIFESTPYQPKAIHILIEPCFPAGESIKTMVCGAVAETVLTGTEVDPARRVSRW